MSERGKKLLVRILCGILAFLLILGCISMLAWL